MKIKARFTPCGHTIEADVDSDIGRAAIESLGGSTSRFFRDETNCPTCAKDAAHQAIVQAARIPGDARAELPSIDDWLNGTLPYHG